MRINKKGLEKIKEVPKEVQDRYYEAAMNQMAKWAENEEQLQFKFADTDKFDDSVFNDKKYEEESHMTGIIDYLEEELASIIEELEQELETFNEELSDMLGGNLIGNVVTRISRKGLAEELSKIILAPPAEDDEYNKVKEKQYMFDLADEIVYTLVERLEYNGYIIKKEETKVEEKERVKPMMFPVYFCPVCGEEVYDDEKECLTCKSEFDWSDQDKFDKIK